jgi:PBP1b-binding outer membrane lipoprotein LpoB
MKSAMRFITVINILLFLVSCAPTEARVQEAIMQTQATQPTATPDYFGMIEHSIALLEFPVQ